MTYEARLLAAQERLHRSAIVIGSMLLDGPDPKHGDETELQAACVEYVEAVRGVPVAAKSIDLALKAALLVVDGGGA